MRKTVLVRWLDPCQMYGWHDPEEAEKSCRGMECFSVGFVVWDDEFSLRITDCLQKEGAFGNIMTIPKVNILEVKILNHIDV